MASAQSGSQVSVLKAFLPIAVILLLAISILFAFKYHISKPGDDAGMAEFGEGTMLPDVVLSRFQGGEVRFSQLSAKLVLVNFWATWCEACMVEMPSIIKLRETYKDRGFEVIAINVDENPAQVVPKAIRDFGLTFPVYTDSDSRLADMFKVHAIPFTAIMDASRKVLLIENGERDWNTPDIHRQIEGWLNK